MLVRVGPGGMLIAAGHLLRPSRAACFGLLPRSPAHLQMAVGFATVRSFLLGDDLDWRPLVLFADFLQHGRTSVIQPSELPFKSP